MSEPAANNKLADLDELCERLEGTGEPVVFHHRGKKFALITFDDLEFFEELEEDADNRMAEEILEKAKGEKAATSEE